MSSQTHDFGNPSQVHGNETDNTTAGQAYNANPPSNNTSSNNPSATGPTGSSKSNDPVAGSYGNTHSSTNRTNPIHPSDPQSTAHPAYGNSSFSSPYETAGGNVGQGEGEGAGVGAQGQGMGAGVGQGQVLGEEYHRSIDATYGHATGPTAPEGWRGGKGEAGPYDTGGGNSTQTAAGETSTHMGGASTSTSSAPTSNANTTTTATVDSDRSTGSKVKEMAHGVKGLFAAVHGAGESARGTFNSGVDKRFNEPTTHNDTIAKEGRDEMVTGNFGERTKVREGVLPGDSEVRRNREL